MEDTLSGLVAIGTSTTQMFDGTEATELLFINLENGEDFSLPITEEQLGHIYNYFNGAALTEPGDAEEFETEAEEDLPTRLVPAQARKSSVREAPQATEFRPDVREGSADDLRTVNSF